MCIHGISRNAHDFNWLARGLAAAGWRVIGVDMVGRGASPWLDDPAGYAMPVYVQHIAHVAATLELGEVDWIGTSMGGLIGMVAVAAGAIPCAVWCSMISVRSLPPTSLPGIAERMKDV